MMQHTIAEAICFKGIGVHSGEMNTVRLFPAPAHAGIRLRNTAYPGDDIQIGRVIPERQQGATVLSARYWRAWTIEHLMAALSVAGIDNVVIEFTGHEVPIRDGSARPFFDEIKRVGAISQEAAREWLTPVRELVFQEQEGAEQRLLRLSPGSGEHATQLHIFYTSTYKHPLLGEKMLRCGVPTRMNCAGLVEEHNLLSARTFGFLEHLPNLQKMGLARGSSLDNTLVIAGNHFMNEPKYDDEWVWHKMLDLVGDLALLGRPLAGVIEAIATTHAFHRQIIAHAVQKPHDWRLLKDVNT